MTGAKVTGLVETAPEYVFSGLGFRPGECAVVSGAAGGIGASVARMLCRSGLCVLAWDIDEAGLDTLVKENDAAGGVIRAQRVDTTDADEIVRAWRATAGMDVKYLVNNAGPASGSPLTVADGMLKAVGSYADMTERYLELHPHSAASVVFTASTAGNFMVGQTPDWYPTAKAGIAGYTRHLAVKLRGRPRANAVAPGATVTARTAAAFALPQVAERLARYPMGRAAYAWEVGAVICFLLSPAASFVNGVLIPVDGASTWVQ